MKNCVLAISNVTKKYSSKTALNHLSLELDGTKIVGLLGPNGSGKTTLMKVIAGLLTPSSGEVLINGKKIGPESKLVVSYLPDCFYSPDNMTVSGLLEMHEEFYSNFDKNKAIEMIDHLHINKDSKLKHLSKGNKEKIQLIVAMSREADLYLLDEPIGGVDPAARDYILETIVRNHSDHGVVLISTHLISDVESILDEAIFIKDGRILLHENVDELRERVGKSVDEYFREVFKC